MAFTPLVIPVTTCEPGHGLLPCRRPLKGLLHAQIRRPTPGEGGVQQAERGYRQGDRTLQAAGEAKGVVCLNASGCGRSLN